MAFYKNCSCCKGKGYTTRTLLLINKICPICEGKGKCRVKWSKKIGKIELMEPLKET